jgi:hypothetical protein
MHQTDQVYWQQQQQQRQQQQQEPLPWHCQYASSSRLHCHVRKQQEYQQQEQQHRHYQGVFASGLLSSVLLLQALLPQHAAAHVAIDKLMQQQQEPAMQSALTAGFDPAAAAAVRGGCNWTAAGQLILCVVLTSAALSSTGC